MKTIGFENEFRLHALDSIPLAVLRRNATQRHGVTRFRRIEGLELKTEDVETIDLHPVVGPSWHGLCSICVVPRVPYMLSEIDSMMLLFRRLEQLWPHHGQERGREFTQFLRRRTATWLWVCATCDKKYPRKRRANGRFRCRACSTRYHRCLEHAGSKLNKSSYLGQMRSIHEEGDNGASSIVVLLCLLVCTWLDGSLNRRRIRRYAVFLL